MNKRNSLYFNYEGPDIRLQGDRSTCRPQFCGDACKKKEIPDFLLGRRTAKVAAHQPAEHFPILSTNDCLRGDRSPGTHESLPGK